MGDKSNKSNRKTRNIYYLYPPSQSNEKNKSMVTRLRVAEVFLA